VALDAVGKPVLRAAPDLPTPPARLDGFPDRLAFFLDLDGTVLDLKARPGDVVLPRETCEAMARLVERLDGALAVVTGRSLEDVDRIVRPLRLPVAALHGAELRRHGGGRSAEGGETAPQRLTAALGAFVDARPGLSLEDKGVSIAVHYRATPERETEVREHVEDLVDRLAPDHELQPGKMVVEVRPRGIDKGSALRVLMEQPPFAGRVPVAFGDDLTDEFAFEAAIGLGGAAILVGAPPRRSIATYGVADPAAMRDWLQGLAAAD
jgi:trehalose 6-phosphate phosphatase